MHLSLLLGVVALLSFSLSGCGSEPVGSGFNYALPQLQNSDNALLVIYRPGQNMRASSGAYPEIFVDDESIGIIGYNDCLTQEVPPAASRLVFTGRSDRARQWHFRDRKLPLNLEAGQTYYFKVLVNFDGSANIFDNPETDQRLQVMPIHAKTARYELPELIASW